MYVDGQGLFSCSSDGTVVLSEVVKGEKKWCVKAHKKGVNDIVWCQSQQWLASCGLGRVILLWQISISTPVFTLEGHQASVQSLCMHEDSNTLISLDSDRVLIMDQGRVAEFAPPHELLAMPDSIFSQLCRQTGAQYEALRTTAQRHYETMRALQDKLALADLAAETTEAPTAPLPPPDATTPTVTVKVV